MSATRWLVVSVMLMIAAYFFVPVPVKAVATLFAGMFAGYRAAIWDQEG